MDHADFDAANLERATAAILKTRDGLLRAPVPVSPLGRCLFLNDVSHQEMRAALEEHKRIVADFPRRGEGIDAFVDASDTGYTTFQAPEIIAAVDKAGRAAPEVSVAALQTNGVA